jgi:hypothetical protein
MGEIARTVGALLALGVVAVGSIVFRVGATGGNRRRPRTG